MKRKIAILVLTLTLLSVPSVALASMFYDISGYTRLTWHSNGFYLQTSTSTTATVDFIQVNTKMYSDGYYIGYIWNSANDASYTSKSVVGGYYGFIQAYGAHDAMDWTGNEATTTYDSLQL